MTAIVAIVLVGLALAIIGGPLLARTGRTRARARGGTLAELEERYRSALADLQDAQNDWEIGNLSEEDYTRFREDGRRRAAQALRDIAVLTEQREAIRGQVRRELSTAVSLATAPAPAGAVPPLNGHAHLTPPPSARARRSAATPWALGGMAAAILAVAGIVILYARAVGVQEAQAPVGSIPAPVPRAAVVDGSGGFWAAKPDGLFQSADGRTWRPVAPTMDLAAVVARNGAPWLALGSGGMLVSNDGGSTWSLADAGPGAAVGAHEGPDGAYAYFAGRGIFRTSDGQQWEQLADPVPERVIGLAIAPGSQGGHILYLATEGSIIRSLNGGRTWSSASGAVNLAVTGRIRGVAGDPVRRAVYVATSDGIFRTTKDGNEWDRLPFRGGAVVIGARGDRLIAIDENGHVFVSNGGGASWTADP